jgi:predicted GH43/DUF377 family glycosyl hydrolase
MEEIKKTEKRLIAKIKKARKELKLPRRNRVDDIFDERMYLFPRDFEIENYPRDIAAVFNPGVDFDGKAVEIFPRFAFDYHVYTGTIGRCQKINIENLISGDFKRPIPAEIILWPGMEKTGREDFRGYEDARIFSQGGISFVLCTGNVGKGYSDDDFSRKVGGVLTLAEFKQGKLKRKGYFKIRGKDKDFTPESNKDATFIKVQGSDANLLLRLSVRGYNECWSGKADLNELVIFEDSLRVNLCSAPWEKKIGWSTNTVPIGSDKYLVGVHSVMNADLSYINRLAVVNGEGQLLAISPDYLLALKRSSAIECSGDRSLVLFGDGLIVYKDKLIWIGGLSDWAIGIFVTDLDLALSKLKWLDR